MSVEFINWYWIYSANIWGRYAIWRVSLRPSGAGLRNVHFKFQTRQHPPRQVPGWTTPPRTKSWGGDQFWDSSMDNFPPDNIPPDKFLGGQHPPRQVPWPGSCPGGCCPGGYCLLAGSNASQNYQFVILYLRYIY